MLYLHSTYHVEPGKLEEYLDIVERLQLPAGEKQGLHLVGYWQTSSLYGPSTDLVALYAFQGWSQLERLGNVDSQTRAMLDEYRSKAQFLRPRYETKVLTPVRFSPLK